MMRAGAKAGRNQSALAAGASSPQPGRAGAGSTGPEAKPGSSPGASISEKPILFSGPMVLAILEGRKSQTRRVIKPQPKHRLIDASSNNAGDWYDTNGIGPGEPILCPYGERGQWLWVRETWGPCEGGLIYAADEGANWKRVKPDDGKWHPSIFMPRLACRLTLEIAVVRVERLQDISEEDAKAEGLRLLPGGGYGTDEPFTAENSARDAFRELWDRLNKRRGFGWSVNPWIWVIEFKRVCS